MVVIVFGIVTAVAIVYVVVVAGISTVAVHGSQVRLQNYWTVLLQLSMAARIISAGK